MKCNYCKLKDILARNKDVRVEVAEFPAWGFHSVLVEVDGVYLCEFAHVTDTCICDREDNNV